MASLVAPLACGVVGAVSGSATFFNEGTGTPATVYSDPEGVTVVTSHVLDANGGIVRYVNVRVDVVVRNAAAAIVRQFTWGTDARETRVENAGFTGTLAGGGTAAGGRTTVDAVLSSLFASFGAIDGKVLVSGVGVNLSTALSGLAGIVFNVKSYGALGNGSTDDRAAIIATIAAAISAGGGIIFFPVGTYKILGQITIPNGSKVCLLGASEGGVIIKQFTTATNGWFLIGTDSMSIMNIRFSRNAAAMTGRVLQAGGKVNLYGCTFDGWGGTDLYHATATAPEFNCFGCTFTQDEAAAFIGSGAQDCRMRFTACSFYATVNTTELFRGWDSSPMRVSFTDCWFYLTGLNVSVCSYGTLASFTACGIVGTGASGSYAIGAGDSVVMLTGCDVVAAGGAGVTLGGQSVYESANQLPLVALTTLPSVFQSAWRLQRVTNQVLVGATTSYTPDAINKVHELSYQGTNVGTLTIVSPTGSFQEGDRLEFVIYHGGVSGPSAIAWNATYATSHFGGPALTATIAMGAVLTFAFTYIFNKWVLTP